MFAPALFLGSTLGLLVGELAPHSLPGQVSNPGAYVAVGMAAVFAG